MSTFKTGAPFTKLAFRKTIKVYFEPRVIIRINNSYNVFSLPNTVLSTLYTNLSFSPPTSRKVHMITAHFTGEESEAWEVRVSGQGSVSGSAFIVEGARFPTLLPTPDESNGGGGRGGNPLLLLFSFLWLVRLTFFMCLSVILLGIVL